MTYGKLADSYPVKELVTVGLVLFNAGSLLGFFSRGYGMLVLARLLQASGGASIPALAMLVATRYFPVGIRGKVLGVIASTVALGAGLGPVLGGVITDVLHWKYLFLLTMTTVVTIPFFRALLPQEETCEDCFDLKGLVLLAGAVTSALLFVTQWLWWTLPIGLVLLIGFVNHIGKAEIPFVHPRLFLNRRYRNTLLTTFLAMGTVFGMMFVIPMMLKALNGLRADQIGFVMFPGAISGALLGTWGGRLVDRIGGTPVVFGGLSLLAIGFFGLSIFAGSGPVVIAAHLVVCYVGFTFAQSSLTHTISWTLPPKDLGIGMGIYNLFFFMSGAFSTALLGRLLDFSKSSFSLNPLRVHAEGALYSNLFVLLIIALLVAAVIFYLSFRRLQGLARTGEGAL
jgi:DHA2 family metal-tetracycline-proton antiporter-like MFS transporter